MNGTVTFRGDRSDPPPAFGLKTALVLAGRGPECRVWPEDGPGMAGRGPECRVWPEDGPGFGAWLGRVPSLA
jgi:hypothetical protein